LTYVPYRDPHVARNNGNDNGFRGDVMDTRDRAVPLDLQGDRKTGFLWYRPGTGYAGAYLSNGNGSLTYVSYRDPHVARSNGNDNGFVGDVMDSRDTAVPIDLRGDGRTGFLWYRPGTGYAGAYLSNGDGSLTYVPYRDPQNGNTHGFTGDVMDPRDCAVPLDLRGDRKTGFLWCRPGAGFASAYLSSGDGSLTAVPYATSTTVDTSSWMQGLKEHIAFTQLNELAIPGAHDAGTYGMVGPACNQGIDVYGQLCSGARYLNLRVIWNKYSGMVQIPIRDPAYYLYHGNFVSDNTLAAVLDQIQRFVSEHPFEILLLDFEHLYQEEGKDAPTARRQVWNMLSERFGSLLVTRDVLTKVDVNHPGWATPDVLWSAGRRIVVFAEDASLSLGIPWLWSRSAITSDYKDTDRPNDLLDYLDTAVKGTRPNLFWMLQTQLTPTTAEAIGAGAAGLPLLQTMAASMNPLIVDRLQNAWRDIPLNIVSGDWIHTSAFCEAVMRTQRCRPRR
jgi:hypothetical protein